MASPAGGFEDKKEGANKKILFRFCSECSNLLFPREDKAENKLLFACRTCSFTEDAPSACVMRHEIASTVGDTAGITQDVGQDPTVGLSYSLSDASLSEEIPDFCTMCGQEIFCEVCGQETDNGMYMETEDENGQPIGHQKGVDKHSKK
ncbi:DNA-directed RNA polymeras-like protein II subunit RPB9 [Clohesyomyces aquaticus]|uniref:DNA-directed RNA polymeras-like protein II subunit RPB9 n=1 Tax=Clohesyomyces aquaticus TaxID=1231657 RepID=A0A1Y1ZYC0_9PLEO|nr:DNA-directed RNA polymeras-like protein II subunit RPB9 [Clohesyomyces aquaticus]